MIACAAIADVMPGPVEVGILGAVVLVPLAVVVLGIYFIVRYVKKSGARPNGGPPPPG